MKTPQESQLDENARFLAIDTETTSFTRKGDHKQENQGRAVQIGMIYFDGTGQTLSALHFLVRPSGWKISEGAQKVHGITEEECEEFGIQQKTAVNLFRFYAKRSNMVIAHNTPFDQRIMEIEEAYYDDQPNLVGTPWYCTMQNNTKITPDGKWPKLELCLQHYCGRGLGNKAHNAMHDVEACRDIFLTMHGVKPHE